MAKQRDEQQLPLRILAVDDDETVLEMARVAAETANASLRCASSAAEAFDAMQRESFDLVFLDLMLGDRSGSSLLSDVMALKRDAIIVVVTADERPATVVDCMKRGAFDYLTKPISPARLITIISHVRSIAELKRKLRSLVDDGSGEPIRDPAFSRILTGSPLMLGMFKTIERIAPSPLAVLVAGESGTGKELVSRAIHDLSRREGAFVPVNVAGLDDSIFADTLFGHMKGAYTGAEGRRMGLVREAANGTLFLDEIGDLGPEAQVKLLRFLQDGEYYPLGSDKPERSSARLVLATNVDLLGKVREGKFRADLYYRLTIHHIAIPPLRARREDIPLLVERFASDAAAALGRPPLRHTDSFVAAIRDWPFPGNVRELFALVNGAMSMSEGSSLSVAYALEYLRSHRDEATNIGGSIQRYEEADESGPFLTLEQVTERHIQAALRRSGGNQSAAARLLGVSQSTISRRLVDQAMKNA
jgi:Response regulator containing CheY-like receiver, AAA-type ATPase, and DNA-binding domains